MGNSSKHAKKNDEMIIDKKNSLINDFKETTNNLISNDNFSKIKQSLKYLHKNNFTSLTFVYKI